MQTIHENKTHKMGLQVLVSVLQQKGYLHKFDFYLGEKEKTELGLGETVVLHISKKLENSYCKLYVDNFF